MASIPRIDLEVSELSTIQGIVPSLKNMPTIGCRFADRCPSVKPECSTVTPQLSQIGEGHEVACLLYEGSILEKV